MGATDVAAGLESAAAEPAMAVAGGAVVAVGGREAAAGAVAVHQEYMAQSGATAGGVSASARSLAMMSAALQDKARCLACSVTRLTKAWTRGREAHARCQWRARSSTNPLTCPLTSLMRRSMSLAASSMVRVTSPRGSEAT